MEIKHLIKRDVLTFQKDETISAVIGKMKNKNQRHALVYDDKKFLGITKDKWLIKIQFDASQAKVDKAIKNVPLLEDSADLLETAYLMFQSGCFFLPVVKNKQIIGTLSALDLIQEAAKLDEFQKLKVSDIKLTKPFRLNLDDPLSKALRLMVDKHLEQLPLFEQGKLTGIISFRDILRKYVAFPSKREHGAKGTGLSTRGFTSESLHLSQLPVSSFSTNGDLFTSSKNANLTNAIDLMYKNNLTNLIVTEGENPTGLLIIQNILRYLASLQHPADYNIQFVGLEKTHLKPYQKYHLRKMAEQETLKLQREIKNEFELVVHIKEYEKAGKGNKRHKYSLNLKVKYPGRFFISNKGKEDNWDVILALRKAFTNLKGSVNKRFRGDTSWKKPYN